jgi:hypothetical protein
VAHRIGSRAGRERQKGQRNDEAAVRYNSHPSATSLAEGHRFFRGSEDAWLT